MTATALARRVEQEERNIGGSRVPDQYRPPRPTSCVQCSAQRADFAGECVAAPRRGQTRHPLSGREDAWEWEAASSPRPSEWATPGAPTSRVTPGRPRAWSCTSTKAVRFAVGYAKP